MQHYPTGTKVFWNQCSSRYRCKRHCFAIKPNDKTKYTLFSGSKSRYAPPMLLGEPILVCQTGNADDDEIIDNDEQEDQQEQKRENDFNNLMNLFGRQNVIKTTTTKLSATTTTTTPTPIPTTTSTTTTTTPIPTTTTTTTTTTTSTTTTTTPTTTTTTTTTTQEPTTTIVPTTVTEVIDFDPTTDYFTDNDEEDDTDFDKTTEIHQESSKIIVPPTISPNITDGTDSGSAFEDIYEDEIYEETVENSPCEPNPCKNGGSCVLDENNNTEFRCECSSSIFFGKFCQNHKQMTIPKVITESSIEYTEDDYEDDTEKSESSTEKFVLQQFTEPDYDYTKSTPKDVVIPPIIKVTTNEIVTESSKFDDDEIVSTGAEYIDYDTGSEEMITMINENFEIDDDDDYADNGDAQMNGIYDSGIETVESNSGDGINQIDYNKDLKIL